MLLGAVLSFAILTIQHITFTTAGMTDLWDFCGCNWVAWQEWGQCNSDCYGTRVRERQIRMYTEKTGCPFDFNTCATSDMAYEYSSCNVYCAHSGTPNTYSCSCASGFYGRCCTIKVNCGFPGDLTNGQVHGSDYSYGSKITYSCNDGYLLQDGSTSRVCQTNHTWNGIKPICTYYDSCSSSPCQNDASCSNIPDDYLCKCKEGWSGRSCDIDVLPPLMSNCSNDISVQISELTTSVEWHTPTFWDQHGFPVEVYMNYPKNSWEFPWGDFNVSYTALKPSNGLRTNCLFEIKVRPHSCSTMAIPLYGVILCNKWKTDYGQICTHLCQESFTVSRGFQLNQWFVCGAGGAWIPSSGAPNCSVAIEDLTSSTPYNVGKTYRSCQNDTNVLQNYYIASLKESDFNTFCEKYSKECIPNNVLILCF